MTALEHGQSLEASGRFAEAVIAYDHAIATARDDIRAQAIAWMNRGNALQKIGDQSLATAIEAYNRAIALFCSLPLPSDPALCNHLGAAWLNRGHALLLAGQPATAAESFEEAIAQLESLPLDENPHYRLNLSGAQVNLAHVLLGAEPARARTFAQAALGLLANVERSHPAFAEMGLRARRAFVMSLGVDQEQALVSAATDTIESGLGVARHWENQGVIALRPLALRLFRLGAQLYRTHQPHFLAEFVLETLAPATLAADAEWRGAAEEAVTLALLDLQKPRTFSVGDTASERAVETLRSLRAAQAELAARGLSAPSA